MRRFDDPRAAAELLASGGVLLLGTDTLPGFHARIDRPAALVRIRGIKGRQEPKPFVVLVAALAAAERVSGPLARRQRAYAARCWPGPFSLVLPAGPAVPVEVTAGGGTVALRVPAGGTLRDLLAIVGQPLVSTSANRAGEEPAVSLAEAVRRFGRQVDGSWEPTGDVAGTDGAPQCASALIDLTDWPPRLLRGGPQAAPEWADLDADPRGA